MPAILRDKPVLSVGATRPMAVDCTGELDPGELLLLETPTIVEMGIATIAANGDVTYTPSSHLVITNKSVNSTALEMMHREVAIRHAVQCKINATSAVAGNVYGVRITASTTSGVLVCDALIVVQ
jgi:hypothetical protein